MAARDGLTGLKNRRAFDEHLIRTWQQALHDRRSLFVMMIDVDCFKKFNDRYGHQAGDEALQRIATVVDGFSKRPLDLAARYGGEELALILFDVSRDTAASLAEQLRATVQNLRGCSSRSDRGTRWVEHPPGGAPAPTHVGIPHAVARMAGSYRARHYR